MRDALIFLAGIGVLDRVLAHMGKRDEERVRRLFLGNRRETGDSRT